MRRLFKVFVESVAILVDTGIHENTTYTSRSCTNIWMPHGKKKTIVIVYTDHKTIYI